jgi:tetratricopeptide (TPR) repeat protein
LRPQTGADTLGGRAGTRDFMQPGLVVADRFRIEEPIGEGGIGRVYRASDLRTHTPVAVKVLRPELARDARVRRRFRREARAVGRLVHPHIVRLLSYGEDPSGAPYLVMELLTGQAMSGLRAQGLDLQSLLSVIDQTLSALAFAHARGVVHRDVKPENIIADLSGPTPAAKLLDFGFARVEDDQDPRLTQAHGDAFGTPLYMAPEQATGKGNIGPPTDLYGIGVVLFEFLTGKPPFTGAHGMAVALKHLMEAVPPLVPRPGLELAPGLKEVVLRALEKDPGDRFQTAADMRRALSPFMQRAGFDEDVLDELPDADRTIGHANVALVSGFEDTVVGEAVSPLLAEPEAPAEVGRAGEEAASPIVGRDADLIWLWGQVQAVVEGGQGRIALLGAPPGMGRGRVTRWLRDQMAEGGWMLCVGGVHGAGDDGAEGLRGALDELFGHLPEDRREAEGRVRALLGRWNGAQAAPVDASRFSALLSYLRPEIAANEGMSEPTRIRGDVLFERVSEVLRVAAADRPVLLTLEGLENAAPETFGLLRFMARCLRRRPFPILVLTTYETDGQGRPSPDLARELQSMVADDEVVASRVLEPLAHEDVLGLLRTVAPLEDAAAEALARRTQGSPLFARELALLLRQTGDLVERGGVLRLGATDPARWPATLSDTILQRTRATLALLPDAEFAATVLDHAVVLGPSFDYDLLSAFLVRALGQEARIEAATESLIRAHLLVENRGSRVDRLHVAHVGLGEALLADVTARGLAPRLHRIAADAKIAHTPVRGLAVALQIAEHFRAAGMPAEAARFFVEAAGHAHREEQFDRARTLLETADRLLSSLSGQAAERQRAMLWLDLGELELKHGKAQRALALGSRVCDWARQAGEPLLEGRALLLVSDLLRSGMRNGNDPAKASAGYARAREAFERAGHGPGVARCLLGQAMVERGRGQLDVARDLFERAREAMDAVDDAAGSARASRGLGDLALRRGDYAEATQHLEAARARFLAGGDRTGATQCQWLLGESWRRLGDPGRALANLTAAANGYGALGDRAGLARCQFALGRLHLAAGRWPEGEECLRLAGDGFADTGDPMHAAMARSELGVSAADRGDLERAWHSLGEALRAAVEGGDAQREAVVRAALAWVAAEAGDPDTATAELQAALDLDARQPVMEIEFARALEGVADVEVRRGRAQHGRALYIRATRLFRDASAFAAAARVDEKLGRVGPVP